jgi:hypothetical protein
MARSHVDARRELENSSKRGFYLRPCITVPMRFRSNKNEPDTLNLTGAYS